MCSSSAIKTVNKLKTPQFHVKNDYLTITICLIKNICLCSNILQGSAFICGFADFTNQKSNYLSNSRSIQPQNPYIVHYNVMGPNSIQMALTE